MLYSISESVSFIESAKQFSDFQDILQWFAWCQMTKVYMYTNKFIYNHNHYNKQKHNTNQWTLDKEIINLRNAKKSGKEVLNLLKDSHCLF